MLKFNLGSKLPAGNFFPVLTVFRSLFKAVPEINSL